MRRATALMSAGLLAATAALSWAGSASAAPGDRDGRGADARTTHQRIVDYWTPERRATAIPRAMVLPEFRAKGGKPGKPDGGDGGGGGDGSDPVVSGATWTDGGASVAKTTGKVFFTLGGSRYVCSASAVAGQENLVLTAGHCVWDDVAKFATNWMFAPGYDNGVNIEYGEWTATSLFTTSAWADTTGNAWPDDAGMAVVTNGSSATLSGRLGSLPAMAAQSGGGDLSGATYSAFGYPAAQKYKGGTLTYCQGPVMVGYDSQDTLSMACDMTGGSSGGPWFGGPGGTGQIVSVNSYGYRGLARMFGPTFNEQEGVMSGAAGNGTCESGETCTSIP